MKKINHSNGFAYYLGVPILTPKMKLLTFLLAIIFVQVNAGVYSQNTKITLNMESVTTKQVMDKIESMTEFRFLYSSTEIDLNRKVTLKVRKKNIHDVIDSLFRNSNVLYEIYEKQVVLKKEPIRQIKKKQPQKTPKDTEKPLQRMVSGTVTDNFDTPLPGANIVVKVATLGTITDFDGNYTLKVDTESVLVFSYIGMITQEVVVGDQSTINVSLKPDVFGLDEIVVVAFGTQSKNKVTTSVSTIKAEEALEARPITSVQQGLSGFTPGLDVNNSSGRPGNFPGLTIRGNGNPIILVDGFESTLGDVDPNQVKEITVLKDAAAAAIFGIRAADGVILITTKSGQRNKKPEFTYGMQTSIQGYTKIPKLANTMVYMQLRNKADLNEQLYINGVDPADSNPFAVFSEDVIGRAQNGNFFDTDWPDILYGEAAVQTSQNLGVSGGSKNTSYSLALGYVDQDGVNISDRDGFNRYNMRVKLETDVTDWLTVGTNTAYTNRKQINVPSIGGRGLRAVPLYPVYDHLGSGLYAVGDGGTSENAVLEANTGSFDETIKDALEVQLNAKVKLFKGLTLEENVGIRLINRREKNWNNVIDFASLEFNGQTGEYIANPISEAQSSGRSLRLATDREFTLTSQSFLRYNWSNNDHYIKVLMGWQTESFKSESFNTRRENFLSGEVLSLDLGGIETGLTNGSNFLETSNLSALGRINYDYRGRYLFEFSFRNDWSSNFAKGRRSGFFPSFSLGWNAKRENFLKDVDAISLLKFRGSWGEVGRDNVSALAFIQRVNQNNGYPWSTGLEPGLVIANYASPNLSWETHRKINLGLDLGLFSNKLNIIADVFRNRRYDILANSQVSLEFGLPAPTVNRRSQEYKGWELVVSHKNTVGEDLQYSVSLNATNVRSKWLSLGGEAPNYDGSTLREEGFPVNIEYGYRADGLIMNQEELDEYLVNHTFAGPNTNLQYIGAPKLVDISGPDGVPDGQIDSQYDREIIDDTRGEYLVGGQFAISYKNIGLSAALAGVFDRSIYATGDQSNQQFSGGVGNAFGVHLESFDPDNPNKYAPYPLVRSGLTPNDRSSYWMRTASYLRVRNINLRYGLDKSVLDNLKFLKKADFYISVENPFILSDNFFASDYGWDPELGIGTVEYPLARTITLGANFTF